MVHLYALADHPARLPAGVGASLAAADVGGIDAIFGEVARARSEPTEELILAHARVVEELAELNDAVLPARLAAPHENEAALVEAIRGRGPALRRALDRVRGCVELGVRVVRHEAGADARGSGTDYMRARLAAIQDAERVAEELDAAVARLVRDRARGVTATVELVLSAAYLLPRGAVDPFRAAVEALQRAHPELVYVCVGPWPPYSFALVDGGGS